ncbi:MAG: tetratricopeptide repeat protein [Actinobacteria bacterium]|nr:tetratricopeptide repeat protein [Actinomycetota bacterium]
MSRISEAVTTAVPQGVVTLLFTDIEGSTKLLHRLGDDFGEVLAAHRNLLRDAFARHGGYEVGTGGDAFFVAFPDAAGAVAAAVEAQRALFGHDWPHGEPVLVRMGLHTGEPVPIDDNYIGMDVHRAARICDAAHGGQVVISEATRARLGSPPGVGFKDLGTHRLKDLEEPEHILQLVVPQLPEEFPPLRSVQPPTNVPHHVGGLVGRSREIGDLRSLLRTPTVRLVTVTGPGGTGKTRLAADAALEALDAFADGVFFVDVTQVRSEDVLATAIAEALDVPVAGDRPAKEVVGEHIGRKRLLLFLDNFERAVSAAPVVSFLLRSCGELKVLTTSRIALSIGGEHEYPLSPLHLPEDPMRASVARSEAGRLFIGRAAAADPRFELTEDNAPAVAEICGLLDGLPLALELAAAHLKLFSVDALLDRLGDRLKLLTGGATDSPERHRTLRGTIDWSYELLDERERDFFRALAVFDGGATLEAIVAVIGSEADAIDALTSLVNHSLVRRVEISGGDHRFTMLQTIRDYALELLEKDPELPTLRERHAAYYLDMLDRAREDNSDRRTELVGIELDNLRAALAWFAGRAEGGSRDDAWALVRLGALLGRYWYTHGMATEGSGWLERAIAMVPADPEPSRALAMRLLGVLKEQQRHTEEAAALFYEALGDYTQLGDLPGQAACLNSLGVVMRGRVDFDAAEDLFERSAEIRRQIGDEQASSSVGNLGLVALDRGQIERAMALFEESMQLDEENDDEWGIAVNTNNLGIAHLEAGNVDRARELVMKAIAACAELGEWEGLAEALEAAAGLSSIQGDPVRGGRLIGTARAIRTQVAMPLHPADRPRVERWMAGMRRAVGEEAFDGAVREGTRMTRDQAVAYALGRHSQGRG